MAGWQPFGGIGCVEDLTCIFHARVDSLGNYWQTAGAYGFVHFERRGRPEIGDVADINLGNVPAHGLPRSETGNKPVRQRSKWPRQRTAILKARERRTHPIDKERPTQAMCCHSL